MKNRLLKNNNQKWCETITKTLHLESGEYEINVLISLIDEPQYGADADGRRFLAKTFVEDIEVIYCFRGDEKITDQNIINECLKDMGLL